MVSVGIIFYEQANVDILSFLPVCRRNLILDEHIRRRHSPGCILNISRHCLEQNVYIVSAFFRVHLDLLELSSFSLSRFPKNVKYIEVAKNLRR
jgi:hypothetical protein